MRNATAFVVVLTLTVGMSVGDPLVILVSRSSPSVRGRRAAFVDASLISLGGMQESCSDTTLVRNSADVRFPQRYRSVERPWMRTNRTAKLFVSRVLQYNWLWMKTLKVRGLRDVTVEDVLSVLDSSGCLFLPWGGSVRDALLGHNPTDVDGEVTCDSITVRSICVDNFGEKNCGGPLLRNETRTVIGNPNFPRRRNDLMADPLDLAHWNSTFNVPLTHWEYTANALGLYDNQMGDVYVIDITGRGVKDACNRLIDITAEREDWFNWRGADVTKLLRYYKLRVNGFRPINNDLREFIVDQVKEMFSLRKMQRFYCKYVLDGTFVWRLRSKNAQLSSLHPKSHTSTCIVAPLDVPTTAAMINMGNALKTDFGCFYEDKIIPAVRAMEMRFLSAEHALRVRMREVEREQELQMENAIAPLTTTTSQAGQHGHHRPGPLSPCTVDLTTTTTTTSHSSSPPSATKPVTTTAAAHVDASSSFTESLSMFRILNEDQLVEFIRNVSWDDILPELELERGEMRSDGNRVPGKVSASCRTSGSLISVLLNVLLVRSLFSMVNR